MNDPAWDALQAYARARVQTAFIQADVLPSHTQAQIARDAADAILAEAKVYFFARLKDMTANRQG
jgi:hypothetical protein